MAADGVREVTLLGQNVNSYGRDLPAAGARPSFAERCFATLLDAIEGIERIRYTSPHPKDMREDVIRAHAELASVCEHIHLPLQSGSSRILKAMRRTYDRERYLDRVALIREHVPDVALTTDIIVGFPGETEEDFEQTLEVVERGRLRRRVHVHLLAAARHRGGRDHRGPRAPRRSRWSAWSGSWRSSSAARASAPSASSGARSRCSSKAHRAPTPSGCAGARATTRSSTSPGLAAPGELTRRRDRRRHEPDALRRGEPGGPCRGLTHPADVRSAGLSFGLCAWAIPKAADRYRPQAIAEREGLLARADHRPPANRAPRASLSLTRPLASL